MENKEIKKIELELLLQAIKKRYGWDFSHYKKSSLSRRIKSCLADNQLNYCSELIAKIMWDTAFFEEVIHYFSIPVTEMYRNPAFFLAIRQQMVPILKTYPFIKIWISGCASGEEAYSLAILLEEEGLYDKTRIYATDFNDDAIKKAKEGLYNNDDLTGYASSYKKAGGKKSFTDYFERGLTGSLVSNHIKHNITFSNHNLTRDPPLPDMNMIMCRNVYIYFDRILQDYVTESFSHSLHTGGFLCLGAKESLDYSEHKHLFETWDDKNKIYRKTYQ